MKKLSLSLSVISCALLTLSVNAANSATKNSNDNKDMHDMHMQLNIMNDIIRTSTAGSNNESNAKVNNVSSLYLYGQGVVFTINTNSNANRWGNYNLNFAMPPIPPVAPISSTSEVPFGEQEFFERNIEETVEHALALASSSFEHALESSNESRENYRELREEQRDLAYEMRDIEREARDLEYQSRRADKEVKEKLSKALAKIEKKKAEIKKEKASIEKQVAKVKAKQKSKIDTQEKQRVTYYKGLTMSLAQTLCVYGNGLKALPKDEHVSLILKSGGSKEGRRYKDQIYVFNKKNISACSIDKIDAEKLISTAKAYQF
mgnify:CR=1 FL=1